MPNEPLAQPTFKAIEPFRTLRRLERLHPARRHVILHRVMAAAQLPRNPLQTPPARPQAQHLRHVIRRLHHLPPWINPRRAFRDSLLVHSLSPRLSKEGAIPRGAEGAVFHGARHLLQGVDWKSDFGGSKSAYLLISRCRAVRSTTGRYDRHSSSSASGMELVMDPEYVPRWVCPSNRQRAQAPQQRSKRIICRR